MLTKQQLTKMFEMRDQETLLPITDRKWLSSGDDSLLLIIMKCAKCIEQLGYGGQGPVLPRFDRIRLELTKLWRFALSYYIKSYKHQVSLPNFIAELVLKIKRPAYIEFDSKNYNLKDLSLLKKFQLMMGMATAGRFNWYVLDSMLSDVEMSWDHLYKMYLGYPIFNAYQMSESLGNPRLAYWDGVPAEEYLFSLVKDIPDDENFSEELRRKITEMHTRTDVSWRNLQ